MQKIDLYLLLKNRHHNHLPGSKKVLAFTRPLGIGLLSVLLILVLAGILFVGVSYARIMADLPSLDEIPVLLNPVDGELLQPTRIMDRKNQTILNTMEYPGIERRYLAINPEQRDHFSPQLVRAVVSKYEPEFWKNPGYSLQNWQDPKPSTIAERLVSDLLLWNEPPSATRAIRMRLLAAQIISRFGRTQVLEWYLNSVYFGHQVYSAESASQLYFEKSASDLTLAEAAMLVVLIDSPALNPLDAPTAALEMQRQFLAEMTQNQVITTDEFSNAIRTELTLRTSIDEPMSIAPAFTHRLIQSLEPIFPSNRLERGGLVIQSTLDLELQSQFVCTAKTQLSRIQGLPDEFTLSGCPAAYLLPTQIFSGDFHNDLSSAGIVLNPQNGEVLAHVEPVSSDGRVRSDNSYEPGSLLTPFVALAGFTRGLSPASLQWDIPSESIETSTEYRNPDNLWHGATNLREAVANDYLIPIANVARQFGPSNAWHLASVLGLNSLPDAKDSEAVLFSGNPVSLLEMASAYGTLANSGVKSGVLNPASGEINPNLVLTVTSVTGRLLVDNQTPDTSSILSRPLTYLINNILSDETARWPSLGYPNPLEIGQTAAVKMGVISSKQQVWTVGYTPERLVLVWMGNSTGDQSRQTLDPRMAAGIWHAMMKQIVNITPSTRWPVPEGVSSVEVCVPSGMLPSVDCPTTMQEVFLNGNEPTRVDTLYEKIKVNGETGQRATVFTNPTMIEEKLFINVPPEARQWAVNAGLAVAPAGYDAISTVQADPEVRISAPSLFALVGGKVNIRGTAVGDGFVSYNVQVGEGINPSNWLQIDAGTSPVTNGELAVWDTAGLDGLYAIRLIVVDQDQAVRTSTIQVTVDNTPPQVKINYPTAEQEIQPLNDSVILQAEVEDSAGVKTVEWWLDGKLVSTQTDLPYIYLMPASKGKHTLQLIAEDNAGNTTRTNKLEFSIVD